MGADLPRGELEAHAEPLAARRISIAIPDAVVIPTLDVAAVDTARALIWHTVEIRSAGRKDKLSGLSASAAQALRDDVLQFVNLAAVMTPKCLHLPGRRRN